MIDCLQAASLLFGIFLTSLVLKFSTTYAPEVKTTPVRQWSVSNDYNDLEVDHDRPGRDAYQDELSLGASEVVDHRYYNYVPVQKAVNHHECVSKFSVLFLS